MHFLEKIFSVKNEGNHKIVCFLGIKLKFHKEKKLFIVESVANKEEDISKIFLKNEIYFNGKRIYEPIKECNVIFEIFGSNNIIKLNEFKGGGSLKIKAHSNMNFSFGTNNIIVQDALVVVNVVLGKKEQYNLEIGSNNYFNGFMFIIPTTVQNKKVVIGNNNLFAYNVRFYGISFHMIYDINTKKQVNEEQGIELGNNIWVGEDTLFLNKAKVPSNSIVAARSTINKEFNEENSIIAGTPAKVAKRNVMWHFELDDSYKHTDNPLEKYNEV